MSIQWIQQAELLFEIHDQIFFNNILILQNLQNTLEDMYVSS